MWVFIDHYDSFTYLIRDYFLQLGKSCAVYLHDQVSLDQIEAMRPERIILSPGPKTPMEASLSMNIIDRFHPRTPILGICLGHQALGTYFGARLRRSPRPMHGKITPIHHHGHPVFNQVPTPFLATRYHSLVLEEAPCSNVEVIARTTSGEPMAIAHEQFPCLGLQFHPESIGSPHGLQILRNWVNLDFHGPRSATNRTIHCP